MSNSPITVRSYPRERAIVNGGIITWANSSGWTTFRDFEITCTNPRTNVYANRPAGLLLANLGHKAINMVIRDSGHPGIFGNPGEVYGCIISGVGIKEYGTGSYTVDNPWIRGAGLYLQNNGRQQVVVSDNISSRCYNSGMQGYAENVFASGFTFDGNILFYNGAGIQNECVFNSVSNSVVANNLEFLNGKTAMGYFLGDGLSKHENLIFTNNYIVDSPGTGSSTVWLRRWKKILMQHNTITTTSPLSPWKRGTGQGSDNAGHFIDLYPATNSITDIVIDHNEYHGGVEEDADWHSNWTDHGTNVYGMFYRTYQPFRYNINAVDPPDGTNGLLSFSAWQNSHGFDLDSTYTTNLPTQNFVFVRPNKYESGRGSLVVINWQSNSVASVDLSSLHLGKGQQFSVVNPITGASVETSRTTENDFVEIPLSTTTPFNVFLVSPRPSHIHVDRLNVTKLTISSQE